MKRFLITAAALAWFMVALPQPTSAQGDLLICSPDTQSVKRLDRDTGAILGDFVAPGAGGLQFPSGLAYGPDGNLYVSDGPSGRILRFHGQTGDFVDVFAQDSSLFGPTDLEFRGGSLYVGMWSNSAGFAGGVARLDAASGSVQSTFGLGNFRRTHALEFDADGELYASNFDGSVIRVFDPLTGAELRTLGSLMTVGRPMGLTFNSSGQLIVNDWIGNVRLIDPTTGELDQILISGVGNNQWNRLAPDGSLLVDNFAQRRIDRYDPDTGAFLGTYATLSGQLEKFIFMPTAIPEPHSTAWLILILLSGAPFVRRR